MLDGFAAQTISVGEGEIACLTRGSGPPILFLHGYPQTKEMWLPVAGALAEEYTVICADLRGYGASAKPPALPDSSNYSFRAMASDQIAVMRALGFERFHLVGHDRGARVAHRLTLDHPDAVASLTVMDIIPTATMFEATDHRLAHGYWHWYWLSQPAPFPERLIGQDADYFFETCLTTWGATTIEAFRPELLASYRAAWRDPRMVHGSCSDYRAAIGVDLAHDLADRDRQIQCPTLVLYGEAGRMGEIFDFAAEWARWGRAPVTASVPGAHYFVDQHPDIVTERLRDFIGGLR